MKEKGLKDFAEKLIQIVLDCAKDMEIDDIFFSKGEYIDNSYCNKNRDKELPIK